MRNLLGIGIGFGIYYGAKHIITKNDQQRFMGQDGVFFANIAKYLGGVSIVSHTFRLVFRGLI